ncbi:hypothetical protein KFL_000840040 [Klebsormidium nitens]|uniref:Uncharacterized protein n=1 Tax=Klebsormidium nitens TaxID=105231 RepID=A0A1Y1HX64_KLENI|nr:hypothetical protein KFL_000840040 [Klebsormidium nitens]|eukprot:GAQ81561.1 hypothetical protein KFL_000840040 [Klebsormidium nitens]
MGELGALAGGAVALWERHEEKEDPEHYGRHKTEETIAEAALVGGLGTALYEHHEKNDDEERVEKYGKRDEEKKHGWFG